MSYFCGLNNSLYKVVFGGKVDLLQLENDDNYKTSKWIVESASCLNIICMVISVVKIFHLNRTFYHDLMLAQHNINTLYSHTAIICRFYSMTRSSYYLFLKLNLEVNNIFINYNDVYFQLHFLTDDSLNK